MLRKRGIGSLVVWNGSSVHIGHVILWWEWRGICEGLRVVGGFGGGSSDIGHISFSLLGGGLLVEFRLLLR